MVKFTFRIPLYKIDVTLVQVEDKSDSKLVNSLLRSIKAREEDISDVIAGIERGCFNGGETFRAFDMKRMLVIFYVMKDERTRAEIYSHEKRHIEDRVLQWASVDDIESAGLLAGFLGEKFYDFDKLVKRK